MPPATAIAAAPSRQFRFCYGVTKWQFHILPTAEAAEVAEAVEAAAAASNTLGRRRVTWDRDSWTLYVLSRVAAAAVAVVSAAVSLCHGRRRRRRRRRLAPPVTFFSPGVLTSD